jgi:two-component system sensor kinase FixL
MLMKSLIITLQDAIDLLPDAVVVVNQDLKIVAANSQIFTVFGYQPHELVNRALDMLIPERYHQQHDVHFRHYFDAPEKRRMGAGIELFGLRKNGREVDLDIALAPVTIHGQQMGMATIRDITGLKELERDLLKKNEELSLANTQLERLGYVIAHDLKSPLLNIHALVGMLDREFAGKASEEIGRYLKMISDISFSMMSLITGVTEYSQTGFQDTAEEDVDLNQVIEEVRKLLQFPPHFQLTVKGGLPVINGNKTKVLQIFLNLVNNAVKYNDKPEGRVEIEAWASQDACQINISDNGPGVPLELRGKIFELFGKGAIEKEGSQGIGLAVVKKIIEDQGGHIQVETSSLGGARFEFNWPAAKPGNDTPSAQC